jgi:tetratricopeptide (TPR) repeat protein
MLYCELPGGHPARGRDLKRILAVVLLSCIGGLPASPAGNASGALPPLPIPSTGDSQILEGLSALHQGRFQEGQKLFRAYLEKDPADPRGHLFLAFSEWWRLLQLRGASVSPDMELHLQEAIRLAQEKLDGSPNDPEILAELGTGYIFLAQLRASQKKLFRSAFAAKKGKALLERSMKYGPEVVDSRFGLGAYNYYADKVNVLVKGLRTVMFLPGGDSARGLAQLQEVAEKGRYFRTEAHLLLAIIYQGHHERQYLKSMEHLSAAFQLNPGSPLIRMSQGELQLRLGRYPEAQATLRDAVTEGQRSRDPDQIEMVRLARVLLADSLALSLHGREALQELQAALQGGPIPSDVRSRALEVATRAATRIGEAQALQGLYEAMQADGAEREGLIRRYGETEGQADVSKRLEPALKLLEQQQWDSAGRILEDLRRSYPASAEIRLHMARASFEQGKWSEAESRLREMSEGAVAAAPAWIQGWRNLYLGRSLTELGRMGEGTDFYAKAADMGGFRARDLARALMGPEKDNPEVWPRRVFCLSIQKAEDANHVGLGLPVGGDAPVAIHRLLAGVVGGEGEGDLTVPLQQFLDVAGSALQVLGGIERVAHLEPPRSLGHQLHQSHGSLAGNGVRIEI